MIDNWTEIKITVDVTRLDEASAIVSMTVPYGIYIEDYSQLEAEAMEIAKIDLIDEALLAKDRTRGIVHVYIAEDANPAEAVSFIESRLKAEKIPYEIELVNCKKEDWENNWKQYFKPLKVGKKLLIRPVWCNGYDPDGRKVLHIEPGIAFGTGTHETTRLCLEAMEDIVNSETELLDVGCGSGILSVAALLLGAKKAVGVDIDELAVKVAEVNGKLNGFNGPSLTLIHGNLTDRVTGTYTLVTANIVADAIIMLTPAIRPFLRPGAKYIVSGIIEPRAAEVEETLSQNGFTVTKRFDDGGWVCMVCEQQ